LLEHWFTNFPILCGIFFDWTTETSEGFKSVANRCHSRCLLKVLVLRDRGYSTSQQAVYFIYDFAGIARIELTYQRAHGIFNELGS
jgi:hypothetical protein